MKLAFLELWRDCCLKRETTLQTFIPNKHIPKNKRIPNTLYHPEIKRTAGQRKWDHMFEGCGCFLTLLWQPPSSMGLLC